MIWAVIRRRYAGPPAASRDIPDEAGVVVDDKLRPK
jgi:hypothetical protein